MQKIYNSTLKTIRMSEENFEAIPLDKYPSQNQAMSQNHIQNLFTDPKSPLKAAPPKVRQVLLAAKDSDKLKIQKLNLKMLGFETRTTATNFCTCFFKGSGDWDEYYYTCDNCSYKVQNCGTMCYCSQCYEYDKHVNHQTTQSYSYSNKAYCDCGRMERFKKSSFCKAHSKFDQIIECEIPENERIQFVEAIAALLEWAIYEYKDTEQRSEHPLRTKIIQYLLTLNSKSVYYNRLTFEVLMTARRKPKSQKQKYYLFYLLSDEQFQKLSVVIQGDLLTRKKYLQFVAQFYEHEGRQQTYQYFYNYLPQILSLTAIKKLIEQKHAYKIFDEALKTFQPTQQCKEVYEMYIKSRLNQVKEKFQLVQIVEQLQIRVQYASNKLLEYCLFFFLEKFQISTQEIQQFIKGGGKEENNPWAQYQQASNNEQVDENIPFFVRKINRKILQLLSKILFMNYEKMKNPREYILKSINVEKLEQILHWMVVSTKNICYEQNQTSNKADIIALLLLIKDSLNRGVLLERMWRSLLRKDVQFHKNIDVFHFVITVLLRADIIVLIEKTKLHKKAKQNNKIILNEEEQKIIQDWFETFLYEKKQVSRDEILDLRNEGILSFKNAGKILNNLCSYKEEEQVFILNNTKVFKNLVNQFPLIPDKQNYGAMYGNSIHYGQQVIIQQGSLAKQLIDIALSTENPVPLIDSLWESCEDKFSSQQKDGYLYVFSLVIIDILAKGRNRQLRQRLQAFRVISESVSQFAEDEDQKNLIIKLLDMQNIEKKQKQMEEFPTKTEKQAPKNEEKKKKILERFKKQRELVLEKISSKKESKLCEQEELCIICHDRTKPANELVYICRISKGQTVCGNFYGKDNTSNTSISSCFHPLHINCFISLNKDKLNFNCPLCSKQSNCILPIYYDKENRRLNTIFENTVAASLIANFQVYDNENSFVLIFSHLIQSLGLNSILELNRYEKNKKIWSRNDEFLQNYMIDMYISSSQEEKKDYIENIDQIIHQIKLSKNLECQAIQLLFSEALKQNLVQSKIKPNIKQLQLIRSLIQPSQFQVIKQQYEKLIEVEVELSPETQQEKNKKKKNLSFKIIELPPTAEQFIEKYSKATCINQCEAPISAVCLFQGSPLCVNCHSHHSDKAHPSLSIQTHLQNLRLMGHKGDMSIDSNLYENEFKIAYHSRNYYEDCSEDEYFLNRQRYLKYIGDLLSN